MIRVLSIAWTVVAGAVAAQGAHDAGRMLEARVKDNAGGVAIVQVYYLTDQRQWKQFGGVWWGSEIGTPDSIVCDVRLVIRGKVLPCPRSAFSDLGNPERVRLSLGPKGRNCGDFRRAECRRVQSSIALLSRMAQVARGARSGVSD